MVVSATTEAILGVPTVPFAVAAFPPIAICFAFALCFASSCFVVAFASCFSSTNLAHVLGDLLSDERVHLWAPCLHRAGVGGVVQNQTGKCLAEVQVGDLVAKFMCGEQASSPLSLSPSVPVPRGPEPAAARDF